MIGRGVPFGASVIDGSVSHVRERSPFSVTVVSIVCVFFWRVTIGAIEWLATLRQTATKKISLYIYIFFFFCSKRYRVTGARVRTPTTAVKKREPLLPQPSSSLDSTGFEPLARVTLYTRRTIRLNLIFLTRRSFHRSFLVADSHHEIKQVLLHRSFRGSEREQRGHSRE